MDFDSFRPRLAHIVITISLLSVLFLLGVGAIALLPSVSAELSVSLPEYASLRAPLLTVSIAFTLTGLVAIAVIAILVLRIYTGTMLKRESLRWIDVLVAALGCAVALVIVSFVIISIGQAGSPFIALVQAMVCITLMTLACILIALRSLLRSAIEMRAELDEVV